MTIFDAVRYRAMKVYANASKIVFLIHFKLFPAWRQEIPAYLPPKTLDTPSRRIPRIIWQTNYTRWVPKQIFMCFRFNRMLASAYEYNLCDDDMRSHFIDKNYPGEIYDAYKRLNIGAAQADLWRMLVLLKHGGVYLDIDANFTDFLDNNIDENTKSVFLVMKSGDVTNYFIATEPGNPVLKEVCDRIVRNINENKITSVYEMTGPVVLDAVVKASGSAVVNYKKVCTQGQFTTKVVQYADKPLGIWTIAQKMGSIVQD